MKNEITIYGDGEQKSEYIYIDDVAETFLRGVEHKKNVGTEVIHVGRGENSSVLDIINALEKAWNKKLNKKFTKMRPGEHKIEISLDPNPLKKHFDYELQWSLEDGLKKQYLITKNSLNKAINKSVTPEVTIYITNYNYGKYLSKAVDSCINQTFKNLEIIIIDDGSTDNSKKL